MSEREQWEQDYRRKQVKEFVENTIDRIRRIADEIEREYKPRAEADFQTPEEYLDRFRPDDPYFQEAHVLETILHQITWGVSNLNLDRIPDLLVNLERARTALAKEESADA